MKHSKEKKPIKFLKPAQWQKPADDHNNCYFCLFRNSLNQASSLIKPILNTAPPPTKPAPVGKKRGRKPKLADQKGKSTKKQLATGSVANRKRKQSSAKQIESNSTGNEHDDMEMDFFAYQGDLDNDADLEDNLDESDDYRRKRMKLDVSSTNKTYNWQTVDLKSFSFFLSNPKITSQRSLDELAINLSLVQKDTDDFLIFKYEGNERIRDDCKIKLDRIDEQFIEIPKDTDNVEEYVKERLKDKFGHKQQFYNGDDPSGEAFEDHCWNNQQNRTEVKKGNTTLTNGDHGRCIKVQNVIDEKSKDSLESAKGQHEYEIDSESTETDVQPDREDNEMMDTSISWQERRASRIDSTIEPTETKVQRTEINNEPNNEQDRIQETVCSQDNQDKIKSNSIEDRIETGVNKDDKFENAPANVDDKIVCTVLDTIVAIVVDKLESDVGSPLKDQQYDNLDKFNYDTKRIDKEQVEV